MVDQSIEPFLGFALAAAAALTLSLALNLLLRPWLVRHAISRPNARSSHRQPTPQGGGIAVVVATLAVTWTCIALMPTALRGQAGAFLVPAAAAVLLAIVGWIDDVRALPAAPRLALQCVAAGAVIMALPTDTHIVPAIPVWLERAGQFVGLVWFTNLVNFMDGIDWMTVAEAVPITAAVALLGLIDKVDLLPGLVAIALCGAILGFAPFNKPVATLFLGDVGSQPIGLLLGWLLLMLAGQGYWAAALLLPLYYLADATLTLTRRIVAGEPFWQAHRSHFYQRATDRGFTVNGIVARVFATNLALVALALVTVAAGRTAISLIALVAGAAIVSVVLVIFTRGKP